MEDSIKEEEITTSDLTEEVSPELTWGERLLKQDRTLSPRHRKLCELAAQGTTPGEIAKQLDYSNGRVSVILSDPLIRAEIERLREKIFEEPIKNRIKKMAEPALAELERCLSDKTNRYKEQLKVETAKWIVEKIDGKAIQTHDLGGNILAAMMDKLDAMKSAGQSSLLPQSEPQKPQIEATDAEFRDITDQIPSKSEEDLLRDWAVSFNPAKKS